jgi:N-terminal acetyltransferase B complex non-catalytic subunit
MDGLQRLINIYKMERYSLTESELTADLEGGRASDYAAAYMKGLPHGSNIPETETQPAL